MAVSRSKRAGTALFAKWLSLGAAVLLLDQVTKFYFEHTFFYGEVRRIFSGFNLVLAHNRGAAFSFLANAGGWQRWVFTGLALCVVAGVLVMLRRYGDRKLFSLSLTLIAAGALGNMIDRTLYGYVIDFLDFYWQAWHWPAFNVADIAICSGAAGLILDEMLNVKKNR